MKITQKHHENLAKELRLSRSLEDDIKVIDSMFSVPQSLVQKINEAIAFSDGEVLSHLVEKANYFRSERERILSDLKNCGNSEERDAIMCEVKLPSMEDE